MGDWGRPGVTGGYRDHSDQKNKGERLGKTIGDWRDYRNHGDQGIYNIERSMGDWGRQWVTGETTYTMGTWGYTNESEIRGVGDWGREWVTGETKETMGTSGYTKKGEI